MGTKRFITLNDERLVRQILKNENCLDRPIWAQNIFKMAGFVPSFANGNRIDHWDIRRDFVKNGIKSLTNRCVLCVGHCRKSLIESASVYFVRYLLVFMIHLFLFSSSLQHTYRTYIY